MNRQLAPSVEQPLATKIRKLVSVYPGLEHIVMLGVLQACPDQNAMKTLELGEPVQDDIIRAVLGLELENHQRPRDFNVLVPS